MRISCPWRPDPFGRRAPFGYRVAAARGQAEHGREYRPLSILEVPEPVEIVDLTMADGAHIVVRRHGNPDARTRVFASNGNGFAIDGYLPFWQLLCPRYDVVVFDMRNHGRNPTSEPLNHDYDHMARDMAEIHTEISGRLGAKPSVGAFHSMSGRAAMRDAVDVPWRWDALVLFDPPDIPLERHRPFDLMVKFEHRLADWAKFRKSRFADPSEQEAEYAAGRAHRNWVEGAHALTARSILRPAADGDGWELCYPGEVEPETYVANIPMKLRPGAAEFGGPVLLVGTDPELERRSPTAATNKAMAEEGDFDYVAIPGTGHMLQLEEPEACVEAMEKFLARHGLAA